MLERNTYYIKECQINMENVKYSYSDFFSAFNMLMCTISHQTRGGQREDKI